MKGTHELPMSDRIKSGRPNVVPLRGWKDGEGGLDPKGGTGVKI